ncbi:Hypothetical predicted protein [Octopus vulgaris]|uniref:Uncharacterized protein n=1 Tax=Octopus vulgaris TaxID=6645 RepID=A0AA36AZ06_OCTVU|nr:Hypothetical predicted protein [Octopus vulgaris]
MSEGEKYECHNITFPITSIDKSETLHHTELCCNEVLFATTLLQSSTLLPISYPYALVVQKDEHVYLRRSDVGGLNVKELRGYIINHIDFSCLGESVKAMNPRHIPYLHTMCTHIDINLYKTYLENADLACCNWDKWV